MNVSIEGDVSGARKSAVRVSSGAVGVKPAYKIEDMTGDKNTFFGAVGVQPANNIGDKDEIFGAVGVKPANEIGDQPEDKNSGEVGVKPANNIGDQTEDENSGEVGGKPANNIGDETENFGTRGPTSGDMGRASGGVLLETLTGVQKVSDDGFLLDDQGRELIRKLGESDDVLRRKMVQSIVGNEICQWEALGVIEEDGGRWEKTVEDGWRRIWAALL